MRRTPPPFLLLCQTLWTWSLLALVASHAAHGDTRINLESGGEFDSNPNRLDSTLSEAIPVEAAGVWRSAARLQHSSALQETINTGLDFTLAGKKFLGPDSATAADVLVLAGTGQLNFPMVDRPAAFFLLANFYDAYEKGGVFGADLSRDFRTLAPSAGVVLGVDKAVRVQAFLSYRWFEYKPSNVQDYQGASASMSMRKLFDSRDDGGLASHWEMALGYTIGQREYQTAAFANICRPDEVENIDCFRGTTIDRNDLFQQGSIGVSYVGSFLLNAAYEIQWNQSNSFGESLLWHRVKASGSFDLPGKVATTLGATLQFNTFLDPLFFGGSGVPVFTIEDENRNTVFAHLSRQLDDTWAIETRVAYYTNEFATEEIRFRRFTSYLGLVYSYD